MKNLTRPTFPSLVKRSCRLISGGGAAKALELHQQAVANPDQFNQLAKQFSEDEASASVGGLIPPIRRYSGQSPGRCRFCTCQRSGFQISSWVINGLPYRQSAHPASTPVLNHFLQSEQINDRIRDEKVRVAAGELFADLQAKAGSDGFATRSLSVNILESLHWSMGSRS